MLSGRVAVITGAAAGIGAEIAHTFAIAGATVVIADLNSELAVQKAQELTDLGLTAVGIGLDVTSEVSVSALADFAASEFGKLDIWVNNAGFAKDAVMQRMPTEDFLAVIHVHLLGTWLGTKYAGMSMRQSGGGAIINMSSIAGKVGNPGQTNYSAAKAGIVGLTKAAAKELARYQIRVNGIQPGLIKTAMTDKMPVEVLEERLKDVPLNRIGTIGDVANAALFLASDLSGYITGEILEVTGGRHM
jgi:3-oxoacyl-[acyl-carrier protein] reductase